MIKKSVFEDEIVKNMHEEMIKTASPRDVEDLGQAVDYLHNAMTIFEDSGMNVQADRILDILSKIATMGKAVMPPLNELLNAGMQKSDIEELYKGSPVAKARINKAFRQLGYSDKDIVELIGKNNFMSQKDSEDLTDEERSFGKMWEWLQNPKAVDSNAPFKAGDEFNIQSIAEDEMSAVDKAVKGLNSNKMVQNLKNHGTVFNMADDNASDDLLNLDVGDDGLEVSSEDGSESVEDFEDEVD